MALRRESEPEAGGQSRLTTSPASVSLGEVSETAAPIARLPFLDGLRGIAALVVVVGHAVESAGYLPNWPGTQMVYLFLLISGFSLAYSEDIRRSRGRGTSLSEFAQRRAWRILPTYYAAMVFGLTVLALVPRHLLAGVPTLSPIGVTFWGQGAHLVLLQNLHQHWLYQGNGPLWSMAYEAQVYLLFPLLFVASRKASPWLVALAAISVNLALRQYLPAFQFAGLLGWFGLGVGLASVYRSPSVRRIPVAALLAVAALSLVGAFSSVSRLNTVNAKGLLWGLAFTCLLLAMTRRPATALNPANGRPLRWLGLRSYSLYALHFPVLWIVYAAVAFGHAQNVRLAAMLLIGVPLSVMVAQGGFLAIERPALARVRRVGADAARS